MDDSAGGGRFFSKFKRKNDDNVENEIVSMLTEGQEAGDILESEAVMITNVLGLDDKSASEIMVPRKGISALDSATPLRKALEIIANGSFSRMPVYVEDIDHIIGILHIKDAARVYLTGKGLDSPIGEIDGLLQKAHFVPETSKIDGIFKNMQAAKSHLVIVVDEYGQTSGILAMEDIIEEIVGKIFDEHDPVEYDIVKQDDNVYIVNALTSLSDVEDETGVEYNDEENDTLNGFLVSLLDRLPKDDEGTELEKDGVKYKILTVEDKTIGKVRMEILPDEESEEDQER